ncbi:unnamed protein product, partial [Ectocarpus sp. 12 AP-2014]
SSAGIISASSFGTACTPPPEPSSAPSPSSSSSSSPVSIGTNVNEPSAIIAGADDPSPGPAWAAWSSPPSPPTSLPPAVPPRPTSPSRRGLSLSPFSGGNSAET